MKVEVKERPEQTLMKSQLDKIYDTILEATKAFNQQYVHMDTLWEILHSNRIESKEQLHINWNKVLDALYIESKKYVNKNVLEDRLPLIVFKTYIEVIKENITK